MSAAILATFIGLSAGCSRWPPNVREAEEVFNADRESVSRLAAKIRSSEFVQVSAQLGEIDAWRDLDGPNEATLVRDDPEWQELIEHSSVWGVTFDRVSDSVYVLVWGDAFYGDSDFRGEAGFLQDPSQEEDICSDRPPKGSRGACVIPLDSDWFILYQWWPR